MRVYYWSDSENRVVSLHLLEQVQNFCLYVVGKVPKGILKQGSLRRTWWRAVVAEQISVLHCQFAEGNEIGATDHEQKQLRPGRGLRPFQVSLVILGSSLTPTTSNQEVKKQSPKPGDPLDTALRVFLRPTPKSKKEGDLCDDLRLDRRASD